MSGRGSVYRRGSTWTAHVKVVHQGRISQSKVGGFRSEKEAQQELTRMLARIDLGIMVRPDRLTVEAYLVAWLEHLEHVVGRTRSTIRGYRSTLWSYAIPEIGPMRIQRVTAADIDRIFRRIAKAGLSASTGRAAYRVLRKSFGDAERQGIVPTNVVTRSSPPSLKSARAPVFPIWTWDQLATFLDHVGDDWLGPVLTFLALTGCRRSEAVAVRRRDINFDSRTVTIARAVVDVDSELVEGDTKSHRSRPVGLDDVLVDMLKRHLESQDEWRLTVGPDWVDRDLVFPGPGGDFLKPATLSQRFERLVAEAGLPRIRLHDLRHTHASLMVEDGRDAKLISERLGHHSVAFTLDRYVKSSTDAQIAAANSFAKRLGRGTR